jgi:RNA polymerase subunit RPABC4/transcription elongation factor Spt4
MKNTNPINFITKITSIIITAFVIFMLVYGFGISFFVIAMVFMLVMVLFFILIAKRVDAYNIENRYERLKECSNCKTIVSIDSEFCPKCGTNLKETVICEYCGHINKKGSVVCEECKGLIE